MCHLYNKIILYNLFRQEEGKCILDPGYLTSTLLR